MIRLSTCSVSAALLTATLFAARPAACQLPADVRASHWAASSVEQVLRAGVMSNQADRQFHGEAHVTHLEAVIAIAAVTRKLESGAWQPGSAKPVPETVEKTLDHANWQTKPVTRYQLASALARFANYFAKAVPHPGPGAKDLGKSAILPGGIKIPVAASSPAYASYKYLTDGRMITPNSPLLKADGQPILASELSRSIADAIVGLNDKFTELGLDETGSTPDKTFKNKKPAAR